MLVYFFVCLVPSLAWLWWIRRQDLYEPEPVGLILQTFVGGMVMALPAIVIERLLTQALLNRPDHIWISPGMGTFDEAVLYCFGIVAPVEEYLKYRTVRKRAYESPEFNEPMDGIVYMTSAAVGFSCVENALYMQGFGAYVLAVRMLLSTFLHIACSGVIGYYLGIGRFHPEKAGSMLRKGFAIAIILHGAYDFLALYQPVAGFVALLILLFGLSFLKSAFMKDIEAALEASPFKPRTTLLKTKDASRGSQASGERPSAGC